MPTAQATPFALKTILVPTDFSTGSHVALEHATALAQLTTAKVVLLHVIDTIASSMKESLQAVDPYTMAKNLADSPQLLDVYAMVKRAVEPAMDQLVNELRKADVSATSNILEGAAYEQIVGHAAKVKADLIVMGTHGRRGVNHLVMGSVAERVVRLAPCPVLTVRTSPSQVS